METESGENEISLSSDIFVGFYSFSMEAEGEKAKCLVPRHFVNSPLHLTPKRILVVVTEIGSYLLKAKLTHLKMFSFVF